MNRRRALVAEPAGVHPKPALRRATLSKERNDAMLMLKRTHQAIETDLMTAVKYWQHRAEDAETSRESFKRQLVAALAELAPLRAAKAARVERLKKANAKRSAEAAGRGKS